MGDAALSAIRVQQFAALDAQAGFQRAGRIVKPRVDYLGIARARVRADCIRGFEDNDLTARARELARHREADDAGTDDQAVDAIDRHHALYAE